MSDIELDLDEGIETANKAKSFEKEGDYDKAAEEYKNASKFYRKKELPKTSAQHLVAHVVCKLKFLLSDIDREPLEKNPFDKYIKKIDGIKQMEFSERDRFDLLINAYGQLEKLFQDHHMINNENEMYFKKTSLYHKRDWKSHHRRSSILNFLLHAFCGHGEKPWWALRWIALTILFFAVLFCSFGMIEFTTSEKPVYFLQSFYFSVVTFTTLGYGDIAPIDGLGQTIAFVEVMIGLLMMGVFIATLIRKMSK
ncbi:MAG: ion channel [Candidatus Omnitrophota bacterium]